MKLVESVESQSEVGRIGGFVLGTRQNRWNRNRNLVESVESTGHTPSPALLSQRTGVH